MDRRKFLASSAALMPAITGCTGGDGGDGGTTPTSSPTPTDTPTSTPSDGDGSSGSDGGGSSGETSAEILIQNFQYLPRTTNLSPGGTVKWVNKDFSKHTVTSATFHDAAADWDFDKALSENGATAKYQFEEQGLYEFYCKAHGKDVACGIVVVGDTSTDKLGSKLPCESR